MYLRYCLIFSIRKMEEMDIFSYGNFLKVQILSIFASMIQ